MIDRLAVCGLGKLGLPLAVAFASRGLNVSGVDVNQTVVDMVNAGRSHVYEPGLGELLTKFQSNIRATTDYVEGLKDVDVTIILVPTPSLDNGSFSNRYVLSACEAIGQVIKTHGRYHVVIVGSTVMPGSCYSEIQKALETSSNRTIGKNLGLCYCPEFVALGNALRGFMNPDFVLIGQSDKRAGDLVESLYRQLCEQGTLYRHMSLINAEIAKIALNFYVTAKISVANTLADICEGLPGANVDVITDAIGNDKRIGSKYLRGGTAFGGECFPRDVRAMRCLAEMAGAHDTLPRAIDCVNTEQISRLIHMVKFWAQGKRRLGILGLTFKPGTDVVTASTGMALLEYFKNEMPVSCFDQVVNTGYSAKTAQECVDASDVIVLTLPTDYNVRFTSKHVVIDCWRVLGGQSATMGQYVQIGVG